MLKVDTNCDSVQYYNFSIISSVIVSDEKVVIKFRDKDHHLVFGCGTFDEESWAKFKDSILFQIDHNYYGK